MAKCVIVFLNGCKSIPILDITFEQSKKIWRQGFDALINKSDNKPTVK